MKRISTLVVIILLFAFRSQSFSQGIVINEFDYDQPNTDSAEFIEIYNTATNSIDLSLYSVLLINGFNNTAYDTVVLPATMLGPGGYFVICGNGGHVGNCDLQLPAATNVIQNGSPDAIAIVENSNGNIVDAVSYEGTVAAPYFETAGIPQAMSDSGTYINVSLNRIPDGHDTNDNSADFQIGCSTPGSANGGITSACSTVGISELSSKRFDAYPNPTRGMVTINLREFISKNTSISVSNVIGKEVKNVVLTSNESVYSLDLTQFEEGIYTVRVKSAAGENSQRLIITK